MIFDGFLTSETHTKRVCFLRSPKIIFYLKLANLMLDFSNESIKTSHSSVLSSLTFGLWVSSHLSNQSAKVGTAECAERLN